MAEQLITCPLCGHEFSEADTLCHHGCPLSPLCRLTRCPACDYELPAKPRGVSWLRRLLRPGDERCAHETPARVATLCDLESGARARVLGLASAKPSRKNALAVFGLAPGAEVSLIERRPAFVVRVGETELALDPEIAREILIEPAAAGAAARPG